MGFYWVFNVVQFLLQLFSRYSSPPFGNFLTMQLGLNFLSSTPWLLLLVLIHIALHLRWTHLKALELLHGLLDTEAFLVTGTLLHPDPSWSWWITPLYKNWHIAVNLIMPYTVLLPIPISETLVLENLKLFSPGHVSLNQSKQAFPTARSTHSIDNEITHPMGYSHGTPLTWNFATLIFKEMFSKYQSIGPSCNFWMNTDLNGASGSTTTSNLLGSYLVLHSLSYCDFVAIKFAKVLSYRDFMRSPDRGAKRQYNLTTVLIRFNRHMSCHIYKTEFICFTLDSGLRQRLYLVYILLLYQYCLTLICFPQLLVLPTLFPWSFHPWSTSATQPWRAWDGLRLRTVELLLPILMQGQATRLLSWVPLTLPLLRPRSPRHLWSQILHSITQALRHQWTHIQLQRNLLYLSRHRRVPPSMFSTTLASHHEWSIRSTSRSLLTPTTPGSYSLKRFQPRESPNVVIPNTISMVSLAIGSGLYGQRTIGAIILSSLYYMGITPSTMSLSSRSLLLMNLAWPPRSRT